MHPNPLVSPPVSVFHESIVDMPEVTANLLFRFLDQNGGRLSKRAGEKEFAKLTAKELAAVEALYAGTFGAKEAAGPASV